MYRVFTLNLSSRASRVMRAIASALPLKEVHIKCPQDISLSVALQWRPVHELRGIDHKSAYPNKCDVYTYVIAGMNILNPAR